MALRDEVERLRAIEAQSPKRMSTLGATALEAAQRAADEAKREATSAREENVKMSQEIEASRQNAVEATNRIAHLVDVRTRLESENKRLQEMLRVQDTQHEV